jgi:hypothetical protein
MRMKEIIELTDNPDFISGIHNYCDRWCERCAFTMRCGVYAIEDADAAADSDSQDINNAAFWARLASIFEETKEMISEWARENGVDLSESALVEAGQQNEKDREEVKAHPLARAAEQYAWATNEWFENQPTEVETSTDAGLVAETIDDDLSNYTAVIRWYQFFIPVKISRGLLSRINEADDNEADDNEADDIENRDSDGSIKVALIAIDRSLSAWRLMGELRPTISDFVQGMLLDLERLRINAEREFPKARDFIRPGFDENLDLLQ